MRMTIDYNNNNNIEVVVCVDEWMDVRYIDPHDSLIRAGWLQ